MDIKNILNYISMKDFINRFEKQEKGYRDRLTGKTYYCPSDLGVSFSLDDCLKNELKCNRCWENVLKGLKSK